LKSLRKFGLLYVWGRRLASSSQILKEETELQGCFVLMGHRKQVYWPFSPERGFFASNKGNTHEF
jgi:hypothetical protein